MTNYYVKTGGDDEAAGTSDGTAWATLSKVTSYSLSPGFNAGDTIYLNRGDTFRGFIKIQCDGSVGSPVTVDAYGTGDKPLLLGSVDLSDTGDWADQGSNIWRSSSLTSDVVLEYNNLESLGTKRTSSGACVSQGDFYYDSGSDYVDVYSTSNPGTYYSQIEAWQNTQGVLRTEGNSYVTFRNLQIQRAGENGCKFENDGATPSSNIILEYCDFAYGGGAFDGTNTQYGNAVQIWQDGDDNIIRYNTIHDWWDAAISYENISTYDADGIKVYRNVIWNCACGVNVYTSTSGGNVSNMTIAHNTIYNCGGSTLLSPTMGKTGFLIQASDGTYSSCLFENNIIHTSADEHVRVKESGDLTGWTLDYNNYYPDAADAFTYITGNDYNFADWKTTTSQDANSIVTDPAFRSVATNNFKLAVGSGAADQGTTVSGIGQWFTRSAPDMGYDELYGQAGVASS